MDHDNLLKYIALVLGLGLLVALIFVNHNLFQIAQILWQTGGLR